jgi:hypothetical protein
LGGFFCFVLFFFLFLLAFFDTSEAPLLMFIWTVGCTPWLPLKADCILNLAYLFFVKTKCHFLEIKCKTYWLLSWALVVFTFLSFQLLGSLTSKHWQLIDYNKMTVSDDRLQVNVSLASPRSWSHRWAQSCSLFIPEMGSLLALFWGGGNSFPQLLFSCFQISKAMSWTRINRGQWFYENLN